MKLNAAQWINLAIFACGSLAMAGWWQALIPPHYAAAASGGLVWIGSVLNFVLTGQPPAPAPAPAPTPPAA